MAMCLISLNDFPRALETHQRARAFCEEHGLPQLVALADYNIAYLYYFRGQYGRAIEALQGHARRLRERWATPTWPRCAASTSRRSTSS